MSKIDIDYIKLGQTLYKTAYRLEEVKDQIEKVAFDIVRFKDNDKGSELWQIQHADDGDYIVALYNNEDEKKALSWEVVVNQRNGELQVYYKGDPIVNLASAKLGIPTTELQQVPKYLPGKLAENKKLVRALLNELNTYSKNIVLNKYPELV